MYRNASFLPEGDLERERVRERLTHSTTRNTHRAVSQSPLYIRPHKLFCHPKSVEHYLMHSHIDFSRGIKSVVAEYTYIQVFCAEMFDCVLLQPPVGSYPAHVDTSKKHTASSVSLGLRPHHQAPPTSTMATSYLPCPGHTHRVRAPIRDNIPFDYFPGHLNTTVCAYQNLSECF